MPIAVGVWWGAFALGSGALFGWRGGWCHRRIAAPLEFRELENHQAMPR